jgi:hypothetical protein
VSKASKSTNAPNTTTLSTHARANPNFDPSRFGTIEISPEFRARVLALESPLVSQDELAPKRWLRRQNLFAMALLLGVLAAFALGTVVYWGCR